MMGCAFVLRTGHSSGDGLDVFESRHVLQIWEASESKTYLAKRVITVHVFRIRFGYDVVLTTFNYKLAHITINVGITRLNHFAVFQ